MTGTTFKPWVGAKYGRRESLFEQRVLVLGESHYGPGGEEHPDTTINVVTYYTQGAARHAFFTKTAKVLLGLNETSWLTPETLAMTFDSVAFYNFIPKFVGDSARQRPSPELWEAGRTPFWKVVEDLTPDLVLILGKALNEYVPKLPRGVSRCHIQHSSTGFSYADWGPRVKRSVQMRQPLHQDPGLGRT